MAFGRYALVILVSLSLLLVSCVGGSDALTFDLVGRWEAYTDESQSRGVVMEFLSDGQFYAYPFDSPVTRLYPVEYDSRRFIYTARTDQISFTGRSYESAEDKSPSVITADIYKGVFSSVDELTVTVLGGTQGLTLHRLANVEMPFRARATLGGFLAREGCTRLAVDPMTGSWQEAFPGYVVADQSRKLPEVPGQWVASLQVEDDPHPRLLILVEGTEEWKWILLQKGE